MIPPQLFSGIAPGFLTLVQVQFHGDVLEHLGHESDIMRLVLQRQRYTAIAGTRTQ